MYNVLNISLLRFLNAILVFAYIVDVVILTFAFGGSAGGVLLVLGPPPPHCCSCLSLILIHVFGILVLLIYCIAL